ncbi:MAG: hypothetical protein JOZ62_07850, partial [Acidobacteriaceae bacterium]|nr:hypothetical protein [Acidobacteriaceae bacterium]
AFTLEQLEYNGYTSLRIKRKTPIDESIFLQLAVRNRKNFGEWLNVMWDDRVAVNILGADPFARIDSDAREEYRILQAGSAGAVKLEGVGAALIVTAPELLLDKIAKVEKDYDLPAGVASRRRPDYRQSYYEVTAATPDEMSRHIQFARRAGLRAMDIYYRTFSKTCGHFDWRPEYPNGMDDLRRVVESVKSAGITPGIHIHYNKVSKTDAYVTPRPDPRLNVTAVFTLKDDLNESAHTITVEEHPQECTLDEGRRILKIQDELITYLNYTTVAPYQFLGCERGSLGTKAASYSAGAMLGLLDVDTWPEFVRVTQNTDIQQELAQRLGDIYRQAGFEFVYFDGAEDVPGPDYWYTVSRAQWVVEKGLRPTPLFAEGACRSHFSWHILTRGNAFDVFKPEVLKAATREYPAKEAARVANDFTAINFGWIGYWAPSDKTIGTQPDMLEYATSRAAAWDCPVSLVGDLAQLEAHPRTEDNLEVLRRWEDIREKRWLTPAQKLELKNLDQEHTVLVNEQGSYELVPYFEIENVAGKRAPARAFVFERHQKTYVVFWHTNGRGFLALPLDAAKTKVMATLGKPLQPLSNGPNIRVPLENRLYLECNGISREHVIAAFQTAELLHS